MILCRNVLIYFNDETAREVVDRLVQALVPGGRCWSACPSRCCASAPQLRCEEQGGVFFYQKACS